MVLHVVSQFERFATELALERPVARMHGQMCDERTNVRKRFATEFTEDNATAGRSRDGRRRRSFAQLQIHRGGRLVGGIGRVVATHCDAAGKIHEGEGLGKAGQTGTVGR